MSYLKQKTNQILRGKERAHDPDKGLIAVIFIILIFGLISLSSASAVVSYEKYGNAYSILKGQLLSVVVGLVAFVFFARTNYHIWKRYAFGFLIFSIVLLLLVFIPGLRGEWGTSQSWIKIFGHSLQPAEFVKISFLLYLAAWLEARKNDLHDFHQGIGPFVVLLGVISGLMLLQPDIGTLSIIAITSLIVYAVGGGSLKHVAIILLAGALAFFILIQAKPYQMNRIKCMLDPTFSTNDICYQINQSLIAVGSGGITGRGLGESRQKFMYLPEVSSDSIFAIIAEETGLIVSGLLVLCFGYLFYRGYIIAKYAPDDFARILSIGIVSWLVIQALINIGGIIAIIPMTGVPLPLVSDGGSAILAALAALGILVNISKHISYDRK